MNPHHQIALHEFILSSSEKPSTWCLQRANQDGHVLFHSQLVDPAPVYGVRFFGTGSDFRARYVELDKIFALTKAEHRVLTDMLEGFEADKIAKSSGVSIETVRSHIRSIYQKLDVSSREGLFHRVRPFRL